MARTIEIPKLTSDLDTLLQQVEDARADSLDFALETSSFTDSDGTSYPKGARGWFQDAKTEADRAKTEADRAKTEAARSESEADRAQTEASEAEQAAADIGALGGIDGTVQSTSDLLSSTGSGDYYYVVNQTSYYKDTGSGSVQGGWAETGPNLLNDADRGAAGGVLGLDGNGDGVFPNNRGIKVTDLFGLEKKIMYLDDSNVVQMLPRLNESDGSSTTDVTDVRYYNYETATPYAARGTNIGSRIEHRSSPPQFILRRTGQDPADDWLQLKAGHTVANLMVADTNRMEFGVAAEEEYEDPVPVTFDYNKDRVMVNPGGPDSGGGGFDVDFQIGKKGSGTYKQYGIYYNTLARQLLVGRGPDYTTNMNDGFVIDARGQTDNVNLDALINVFASTGHPFTDHATEDTILTRQLHVDGRGGASFNGFTKGSAAALAFRPHQRDTTTAVGFSAGAAIEILPYTTDGGTSRQKMGADKNVLAIQNGSPGTKWIVKAGGKTISNAGFYPLVDDGAATLGDPDNRFSEGYIGTALTYTAQDADLTDSGSLNSPIARWRGYYDSDGSNSVTASAREVEAFLEVTSGGDDYWHLRNAGNTKVFTVSGSQLNVGVLNDRPSFGLHQKADSHAVLGARASDPAFSDMGQGAYAIMLNENGNRPQILVKDTAGNNYKHGIPMLNTGVSYSPSNDSTDRVFDAGNTTASELADVLATLLKDLNLT